jgi:hypothetical protein
VICRDRAGAYAEGARDGAPDAVQVADRWHLWHNLAEHTAKAVARHRACLKQIAVAAEQAQPPPEPIATAAAVPPAESRLAARMRDQHAAVQALAARGLCLRAIARELGVDRKTARRFAHATTGDQAVARAISRPTVLDRYQPHLHRRWAEGCRDAAALHAEIAALGYRGSVRTVYRYLQPLRTGTDPAAPPKATSTGSKPSSGKCTAAPDSPCYLLTELETEVTPGQRPFVGSGSYSVHGSGGRAGSGPGDHGRATSGASRRDGRRV